MPVVRDSRSETRSTITIPAAIVVLGALLAGALLIRVQGIDEPLLTFHPTRQYRSAMIARACYYETAAGVPEWARRVAVANRQMQPVGEPPLMEWLACAGYHVLGREDLRIPKAVAVIVWLLGAVPLYRLAIHLSSVEGALVAVAIYLFVPYGILASRSFQPDQLMTTCSIAATLAVVRYDEQRTLVRMLVAATAIAAANLVKPMSIFFVLPAVAGIWIARRGWRGAAIDRDLYTLVGLGFLPPVIFYGYGALFGRLVRDQFSMRFVPALVLSPFFWRGWLTQIRRVFGLPLFAIALAGVPCASNAVSRNLQAGLWTGYAIFAIAFTYHMPTHDYYHLPFIAAAALGTAAVVARVQGLLGTRVKPPVFFWSVAAGSAVIAVAGSAAVWPRLRVAAAADKVRRYEEIGEVTHHDARMLFLDQEYGYPLMYHGQVSGDAWPNADDLTAESLAGVQPIDAETRFNRDYADFAPRYFIATDLPSLDAQPDLVQFLERRATLVRKTAAYQVHKLRE